MTTRNHFKFPQSKKWLEDLAPQHCAPMCEVDGEHYYIFEPVELVSKTIFITKTPNFIQNALHQFYKDNKKLIKLKIPQDIKFNDPNLQIIPTIQFNKCYNNIEINGKNRNEHAAAFNKSASFGSPIQRASLSAPKNKLVNENRLIKAKKEKQTTNIFRKFLKLLPSLYSFSSFDRITGNPVVDKTMTIAKNGYIC